MLHQHRHITRWRSASRENGDVLSSITQQMKGLSVTPRNHLQTLVCYNNKTDYFNQICNNSSKIWGSSDGIRYRNYSSQRGRSNFFTQLIDNIKQEMEKSKEMKENIKKFREEAEKLEQSDALKKARAKYMTVENEASILKAKLGKVKDTVSGVFEEASKSEIAKKAGKITEDIGKSARGAAESISAKGHKLGETEALKKISQVTTAVKEELEQSGSENRVYVSPAKLRKRVQESELGNKVYAADSTTMDVELHKDSRFYESWQNFKNNNPYVNKILDWKLKYEESENPMIRLSRAFTDKVSYVVGGMFQNTELSEALTEIVKVDPGFTKSKFLRQCETDIIPNILEAMVRGDLEILKDWCHEGPYNLLSTPIRKVHAMGAKFDSKILDLGNLDLVVGKITDSGPVLIITFTSQQILCVRDKDGKVIEGDPEKVLRVNYVWALSRDKSELDPNAAWRLLDITANSVEQLL